MEGITATAGSSNPFIPSSGVFPRNSKVLPPFSVTKPSWTVRTESNVWKEERRKPQPSCLTCGGSGRINCHHCQGKGFFCLTCTMAGRTNCTHLSMLPKGEWPKWCKTCGGSGLGYCSRCLGTGEYRDTIGFHFMKNGVQERKQKLP